MQVGHGRRRSLCGAQDESRRWRLHRGYPTWLPRRNGTGWTPGHTKSLYDAGLLEVAEGLRVQPPGQLWEMIKARWGVPVQIVSDFFQVPYFQDAVAGAVNVEPRRARWSEATADIRALQSVVKDGPFAVAERDQPLLKASLSVCMVKHDDAGNTRLVKKGVNNTSRDDVAAASSAGWRCLLSGQRGAAGQRAPIRHHMSRHHLRLNKRLWARARWTALERDNWRCCHCGKISGQLEVDHVRRLEAGGDLYDLSNLQTLCKNCHFIKTGAENGQPNPEREEWRAFMRK